MDMEMSNVMIRFLALLCVLLCLLLCSFHRAA
jgi:hypothetical protein